MPIDPIFWLIAAIGFLVLEGMTFSMVSVWFAAGSAAALLCCLFTHSFRVQAVVFIAVSAVCLLAFKPLAKRLHKQPTPTNGDRALGREARVLTPVSAQQTHPLSLVHLKGEAVQYFFAYLELFGQVRDGYIYHFEIVSCERL